MWICMLKVWDAFDKQKTAKKIIIDSGGIARTSSLNAVGLSNVEIAAICMNGIIERIKQGYYKLPDADNIPDERLLRYILFGKQVWF